MPPIFLISVPFVAVTRITTASFYACFYVCVTAIIWRTDHDLVEYSICKNIVSLFGPYFKKSC